MADTDPFNIGVFYEGSIFITREFVQTFSNLNVDRRLALMATIQPKPQVSQLIINYAPLVAQDPDNLSAIYHWYHVDAGGSIVGANTPTQFADKTDYYVNKFRPPAYLVMNDETGGLRYITSDPGTATLVSSATKPATIPQILAQFMGPYIEMVGANGQDIYRITVNSSDVITCALNRSEPERTAVINISHGHSFPYDPLTGVLWIEGLIELGEMSTRIEPTKSGFAGVTVPRLSHFNIQIADREYEYLALQSWNSRDVEIKMGLTDEPISEYRVIIRGKTERHEADLNRIRVSLRDQGILFDRNIQENRYAGTGGYEGNTNIQGVLKPLTYGFCRHVNPVMLDEILFLYQVHDGPINQIVSVYAGGILLTNLGDDPNLLTWNPTQGDVDAGGYRTNLSNGTFRLAARAYGTVTMFVHGSTRVPQATARISDIVKVIVEDRIPEALINNQSFADYYTYQPGLSGIYIRDEQPIKQVFRDLVEPVGGLVSISLLSEVHIRQMMAVDPVAFFREGQNNNISEQHMPQYRNAPKAGAIYRIGRTRSWTVMTEDAILEGASVNNRVFLQQSHRYESIAFYGEGNTRLPVYDSAEVITYDTLLESPTEAKRTAVFNSFRDHIMQDLYEIVVIGFSYMINVGDTVLFQMERLQFQGIHTGIVVGVDELPLTNANEDFTRVLIWH